MTTEIDLRPALLSLDNLYAIEPLAARQIADRLSQADLASMRLPAGFASAPPMVRHGAVAVIEISGVMSKLPSMYQVFFEGTSTEQARQALEASAADPEIAAALLKIDTPGGTVDGLAEFGDAVWAARQQMPVYAQVYGMAASAGYYVASQATKIFAGRMDVVGSIGTRLTMYDFSRMFANEGVEPVSIDTGPLKSLGVYGTEITDDHKAYLQGFVDRYFADFVALIVRGRGMTEAAVRELATGALFVAEDAQALGLIDGIQTFDETLSQLQAQLPNQRTNSKPRNRTMSEESTVAGDKLPAVTAVENSAADYAAIVAACPGADEKFICGQLAGKATVDQARHAWMKEQQTRLEAATKETEQAKAAAARPGVDALGGAAGGGDAGGGGDWSDPVQAWNQAVDEKVAAGMSKQKAASTVNRQNPGLREACVAAYNEEHPPRRR